MQSPGPRRGPAESEPAFIQVPDDPCVCVCVCVCVSRPEML